MSTLAINAAIKVLLVEDNPGDARMIREILRDDVSDQFDLTLVESLAEAVAALADKSIDLILLDLSLPDATGLDTLTRMQRAAHNVPIIVLTGHSDATLGLIALREGAQDYLLKQNLDSHLLSRVLHNAVDHKRATQVQRESEERFRALVQHSTDIITILAADGTVLYESPSLERVMGYRLDAVNGLNMAQFIHVDDLPGLLDQLAKSRTQFGMTFSTEFRVRHADGSWRTLEATITNLLNQPAIHGIVVNSRDVTERRRGEEALKQSEALLQAVLAALPIGVVITDAKGQITHLNPASQQIWAGAKYLGVDQYGEYKAWWLDSGKRVEATQWGAARAIATGETSLNEELEIERFDGVHRFMLNSALPILDTDGDLAAVVAVNEDITERKYAERALRQYNQRLEILHGIDRGILTAQPTQQIAAMIAQALTALIHCDAVRIITLDSEDKIEPYLADYPPASQTSHALLRQAMEIYGIPDSFRQGEALRIDDVQTSPDLWKGFEAVLTAQGARAWIIVPLIAAEQLIGILALGSLQPRAFSDDHFEIACEVADQLAIALHKSHLDAQIQENTDLLEARVTDRTEQLHAAKERIETILMSASDAMVVMSMDGMVEQINPAFTALFGLTLPAVQSTGLAVLVAAESLPVVRLLFAELQRDYHPKRLELVCVRGDGTVFHADAAFAPVAGAQQTSVICSLRDITERKQLENELQQAWAKEKHLNALKSSFVSMVSHDFRTPLASIQSSSDLLHNYSQRMTDDKKEKHFETIQLQIKHLTDLLEDTLTLTKADSVGMDFNPVGTDLELFCQALVDEIQMLAGTRTIRLIAEGEVGWVTLDPQLLRRALVNLLTNAVKYSLEGSMIELTLVRETKQIMLRIQDHGIGIPEADQVRLFEVFHRAKNVGEIPGTGLGLAIVKLAVEAHGGTITVESQINVGTAVSLSLPLNLAEAGTL